MLKTSNLYQDYVVFVECKSLRGRSKAEYLRQVRKLGEHYPQRSLKQLTERQVFDYLIFRRDQQKLRPPPSTRPWLLCASSTRTSSSATGSSGANLNTGGMGAAG